MQKGIKLHGMREDVPADERARLAAALEASAVPEHLRAGLVRYLVDRILPGGFLQAVLCGKTSEAIAVARYAGPPIVALSIIADVWQFLRASAPPASWGSRAAVLAWTSTPDRLETGEFVVGASGVVFAEFVRRGLAAAVNAELEGPGDLADVADDDLVAAMAIELEACEAPIELVLQPATALHVAGLVQLALRHRSIEGRARSVGTTILAHVRTYFAEAPAVLEALRRGDDPGRDR
jgi:hypothetical protein